MSLSALLGIALAMTGACESSSSDKPEKKADEGKDDGDAETDGKPGEDDANKKPTAGTQTLGGGAEEQAGEEGEQTEGTEEGGVEDAEKAKKKISFKGSKGDNVPGYLWLPKRKNGQKFPTVLVMYGINGDKDSGDIAAAAIILNDAGFVAMTLDWPGTGERGDIKNSDRITKPDVMNWTVGDYAAAYGWLQTQPEVDGTRMAYVGASMGAMTGLVFASRDPRVKAMVAIVPIPNPLWGGDDPSSKVTALSGRPMLCIYTADNSDFSGNVCSKAPEKKGLPGGHELEGYKGQVVAEAKNFLVKHLKP